MFKKLIVGTLATGIVLSGAAGASAAELSTSSTKTEMAAVERVSVLYKKGEKIKPYIYHPVTKEKIFHIEELDEVTFLGTIAYYG